ncbi:hypothetical protein BH11PLA2_BH11PLA2_45270 [soil metagenome]
MLVYCTRTVKTVKPVKLRRTGTFERAFVTGPICSPSRSALITGMYQISIGAQHHRSSTGKEEIQLPPGFEKVPRLFQQAGYYTCNVGYYPSLKKR